MSVAVRPEDDAVKLVIGDKTISGWEAIELRRGVERLPSEAEIRLTSPAPAQISALPKTGSACRIYFGDDQVLTGYVDRRTIGIDPRAHEVALTVRSKTSDLVDCSIDVERLGYTLHAVTIGAAAKLLCKPYGINVKLPDGDFALPVQHFAVTIGMSGYQMLEEFARVCGVLLWDDGDGNLLITKGGTGPRAGAALVEGSNLEAISAVDTQDQRFQRYVVLAQAANVVMGYLNPRAVATDPGITRNRLRVIAQEVPGPSVPLAEQRARWEAARRFGRSQQVRGVVSGWRDGAGKLWSANSPVALQIPSAQVNRDMVIADVVWRRDAGGTTAVLTCMPKEGLLPQPLVIPPINPGAGLPAPH